MMGWVVSHDGTCVILVRIGAGGLSDEVRLIAPKFVKPLVKNQKNEVALRGLFS